ncbi:expressed unknown protein [Seminavis robusta]|uniref:Uncharacterized protein n=1 Tax=Seminavis robusta TaxID=568900 RepID=A0A9N8EBX8_9STRA|nr:expressed unknown protein [Seminavis robusta]|eukprot:Sro734_g194660.1 n/a (210) ;mRNA; f:19022-19651
MFVSCFPRPLPHRSTAKRLDVSVEQLFNPLLGLVDSMTDSDDDTPRWKTSQVELSQLLESDDERSLSCNKKKSRHVCFALEPETVALIPSHRDMTDVEWNSLFWGCDEIDQNARRNRVEFQVEGNWRNVLEESEFTLCSDGCLYHPVTVEIHLRNLRAQQVALANAAALVAVEVNSKKRKRATHLISGETRRIRGAFKRLRATGALPPQ